MLYPNVLFHSIDNQESVDNARKLNAQFDGIGPSALDGFVTLLATSKDKLEEAYAARKGLHTRWWAHWKSGTG